MLSNKYDDAITRGQQELLANPDDMGAVERMARALRAKGEYGESIDEFERLAAHHREDKIANSVAPGSAAYQIDIACLHWLIGDQASAISKMHGLVAGILNGSIKYGDAAGGLEQGLLLYYMGITARNPGETSYALKYLRNRVERLRKRLGVYLNTSWPCSVARYHLGDIAFEAVMERVNDQSIKLAVPDAAARLEVARRKRLALALFHDGVKSRAEDDETRCLACMRECYGLEAPPLVQEWHLARYEVERSWQMT